MKRALILLTLNEIDGVKALIPKLPRDVAQSIVAVDGGSTDGTREWLTGQGIRVVGQSKRGRGEAFREGLRAVPEGEAFVYFSPDGNEDLADIPKLFQVLEDGADITIASRFLPGSVNEEDEEALPLRKWTNQAFTLIANLLWNRGPKVTDTINGFRGITRKAFESLNLESMSFTIEYEMSIRAMKKGLKIVEIPTHEGARVGGETKAPSFRTGLIFVKFLLSEITRRG